MSAKIETRSVEIPPSVRVLGLDLGLSFTGYAIADVDLHRCRPIQVRDMGVIETLSSRRSQKLRRTSDDVDRAHQIAAELTRKVDEHSVDAIAAEIVTSTPYVRPTFSFGVLIGITVSLGRPVIEILPREAKRASTGYALATKGDVIAWAMTLPLASNLAWPISKRPNARGLTIDDAHVPLIAEHQADALAVVQAASRYKQYGLAAAALVALEARQTAAE